MFGTRYDDVWGNLPQTNTRYDLLKKSERNSSVKLGKIGSINLNRKTCDINMGVGTFMGSISSSHQHWYSGGDFSISSPGVNVVAYNEGSLASICSYIANENAQSFYRINYGKKIINDLIPDQNKHYLGGMPVDSTYGDTGHVSPDGYMFAVPTGGPLLLRANPMAQMEFYDLDTSVKLNSLNFIHNTGLGYKQIAYSLKKNIADERKELNTENPLSTEYNVSSYLGSIGNLYTHYIKDKFYLNQNKEGSIFTKSLEDIIFSIGKPPLIKGIKKQTDPLQPQGDKEEPIVPLPNFDWKENTITQEREFIENHTNNYYCQTFDLNTTSENYSSSNALGVATPSNSLPSAFHLRKDGTIIIMSSSGSSIELNANGDIVITPKRHLKIQSGGNVSVLAGEHLNMISKESGTIRSTDKNIQLIANDNIHSYTNNNIIMEAKKEVNLLSDDKVNINSKDMVYYASGSIEQKSSNSTIEANNIKLKSKNYVNDTINYGLNSNEFALKVTNSIKMLSTSLQWGGYAFKLAATSSGSITASIPVQMNHVHASGFKYVWCGKGRCKTTRIEENIQLGSAPSVPNNTVDNLKITKIAPPKFDTGISTDEKYYLTPWQLSNSKQWTTLTSKIKDQTMFPEGTILYGKNMESLTWDNYII